MDRLVPAQPDDCEVTIMEHCPDCNGDLYNIKLLDATESTRTGEGMSHVEMSYAAPEASASFFSRSIAKSGTVKAKLCNQCGRIFLYASRPTPLSPPT